MGQCPSRERRAREQALLADQALRIAFAHAIARGPTRDPRTGHTVVQGRRAQRRFKTEVRRIIHWLLLRKRWSAVGRLLQQQPRLDLWVGLRRVNGRLTRQDPAPIRP